MGGPARCASRDGISVIRVPRKARPANVGCIFVVCRRVEHSLSLTGGLVGGRYITLASDISTLAMSRVAVIEDITAFEQRAAFLVCCIKVILEVCF